MQNISTHIKQVLDDKHNLNVKVIISKVGEYKMYGSQELDLSGDYDIFTVEKNLNYYKIIVKEEYYLNQLNTLPNDIIPTTKTPTKIVIDYHLQMSQKKCMLVIYVLQLLVIVLQIFMNYWDMKLYE